jgi:integral membrane sensor domain MASE1
MRPRPAVRIVTVLSSIALITGIVFGTNAASSLAAAKPSPTHVRGFVRIANEVVPQVQRATVLGARSVSAPMSLSIALPNRDAAGLNTLI